MDNCLTKLLGFSYNNSMNNSTRAPRQHNLPIDEDYYFISAYEAEEVVTACDNCDRPIRNVATIRNTRGQKFDVGMDCVEVLLNDCGSFLREQALLKQAKKEFSMLKAIKKLAKEGKLVVALETLDNPYRENWFAFNVDNPASFKYSWIKPESELLTQIVEVFLEQDLIATNRFDARGIAWAKQFGHDHYYEWNSALNKRVDVKI